MIVSREGGRSIKGVADTILGVCDGKDVHTGKGCGGTPHVSHAARTKASKGRVMNFFMHSLYPGVVENQKRG